MHHLWSSEVMRAGQCEGLCTIYYLTVVVVCMGRSTGTILICISVAISCVKMSGHQVVLCSFSLSALRDSSLGTSNSNSSKSRIGFPGLLDLCTSGCNRGAAVKADTMGKHQLKRMQSGSS